MVGLGRRVFRRPMDQDPVYEGCSPLNCLCLTVFLRCFRCLRLLVAAPSWVRFTVLTVSISVCQELSTAERVRRQAQAERDELQDEINSSNTKRCAGNLCLERFSFVLCQFNPVQNVSHCKPHFKHLSKYKCILRNKTLVCCVQSKSSTGLCLRSCVQIFILNMSNRISWLLCCYFY